MTSPARTVRVRMPDGSVQRIRDGGSIDLDREVVRGRSGRRVDEAAATAMAEEIEARPGPGRPSLSGERASGESKVIRARVPQSLHEAFTARAAAEHKAQSEVLRDALVAYLDWPTDRVRVTIAAGAKAPKKVATKVRKKAAPMMPGRATKASKTARAVRKAQPG